MNKLKFKKNTFLAPDFILVNDRDVDVTLDFSFKLAINIMILPKYILF